MFSSLAAATLGCKARPAGSLSLIALALAGGLACARADELTVEPSISVQGRVDNNPLMRTTNSKTAYIGTVSPSVALHDLNDQIDLKLSASANIRGYSGLNNTNSDDEIANLDFSYLATELTKIGLNASINRITLLDQLVDNNGSLTRPARTTTASVSPSTTFLLGPTDQFQVSGFFTDQSYDTPQLINYRTYGGSVSWDHNLSDTSSASMLFFAERAEPESNLSNGTDIIAAEVTLSHTFPRDIKVEATVGPELRRPDIRGPGQSADQVSFRAALSVTGALDDVTNLSASFIRQSQPTSAGGVALHNIFHLAAQRQLGPQLSIAADADYVIGDAKSATADNLDNYLTLSIGPQWQVSELSSLNLSYSYRREAFLNQSAHAISNGVYLSFKHSFVPPPQQ